MSLRFLVNIIAIAISSVIRFVFGTKIETVEL